MSEPDEFTMNELWEILHRPFPGLDDIAAAMATKLNDEMVAGLESHDEGTAD